MTEIARSRQLTHLTISLSLNPSKLYKTILPSIAPIRRSSSLTTRLEKNASKIPQKASRNHPSCQLMPIIKSSMLIPCPIPRNLHPKPSPSSKQKNLKLWHHRRRPNKTLIRLLLPMTLQRYLRLSRALEVVKERWGIVAERSRRATQCPSLSPSITMKTAPARNHTSRTREAKAIASTSISKTLALPVQTSVIQICNRNIEAVTICKIIALITVMAKCKARAKVRENTVRVTVKTTKRLRIITRGSLNPRATHSRTAEATASTELTMVIAPQMVAIRTGMGTRGLNCHNKTRTRTLLSRLTIRIRWHILSTRQLCVAILRNLARAA